MTTLQLLMLTGMLLAGGVVTAIWAALPAEPDLSSALDRLSPHRLASIPPDTAAVAAADRLGLWAIRRIPHSWVRVPTQDLAILRKPLASFYADKLAFTALAAVAGPLLSWLFSMSFPFPLMVPAALTLAAMVVGWFLPDLNVRQDAVKARAEFSRVLGAYTDLVALERYGGSGSRQAMEQAAEIGDNWVFRRISEELARSRLSAQHPWDALHHLAGELGVPGLHELADIMRLSGEAGAPVYENLRAHATASRNALLSADQTAANEVGERMFIASSLTAVVFLAILIAPAIFRLLTT